jgi:hypothetical protein
VWEEEAASVPWFWGVQRAVLAPPAGSSLTLGAKAAWLTQVLPPLAARPRHVTSLLSFVSSIWETG